MSGNRHISSQRAARRAFTLLELLVCVAIIAILTSVAVPSFAKVMKSVRSANCQGRLAGLVKAGQMYSGDNRNYFPDGPVQACVTNNVMESPDVLFDTRRIGKITNADGWYGQGLLWKGQYLFDGNTYYCPAAENTTDTKYSIRWPKSMDGSNNPADGKTKVYCAYAYRGGLASKQGTPEGVVSTNSEGVSTPLFADNPLYVTTFWHDTGYNIACSDGRVYFAAFPIPVLPASGHLQDLWQLLGNR